jgi:hypothetical protein
MNRRKEEEKALDCIIERAKSISAHPPTQLRRAPERLHITKTKRSENK